MSLRNTLRHQPEILMLIEQNGDCKLINLAIELNLTTPIFNIYI